MEAEGGTSGVDASAPRPPRAAATRLPMGDKGQAGRPLPSPREATETGPRPLHSPAGRPVSLGAPLPLVPVALPEAALGTGANLPAAAGQAGVGTAAAARGPGPAVAVGAGAGAKR